jgi:hypothetical protein
LKKVGPQDWDQPTKKKKRKKAGGTASRPEGPGGSDTVTAPTSSFNTSLTHALLEVFHPLTLVKKPKEE